MSDHPGLDYGYLSRLWAWATPAASSRGQVTLADIGFDDPRDLTRTLIIEITRLRALNVELAQRANMRSLIRGAPA